MQKAPDNFPLVSVIMPIRNEGAFIERSLGSVLSQDYSHNRLEVLVADGNSTDDTRLRVADIREKKRTVRIEIIENPGQFMPVGFNRALQQARGDVIIMLGGHAEIAPDYVSQCVQFLQATDAGCVGGAMETIAEHPAGRMIALAMRSRFGVGGVAFRTLPGRVMEVDTAVFAAYRREVFMELGGLDEEMIRNQDDEFNYRLRAGGRKILFSPSIRSRYYSRASFTTLWNQYFQYGLYKVRVLQKHPRQMSPRQFAPPLFVLALVASAVLAFFPFSSSPVHPAWLVPCFYTGANLIASFLAIVRNPPFTRHHLLLPVAFAILHTGYGLGFWAGLFKFWNRWGDRSGRVPALQVVKDG